MRPLVAALTLLLAFQVLADALVAPQPTLIGAAEYDDLHPASVSNGTSTLVAWVSVFHPYYTSQSIGLRMLGESPPEEGIGGFNPFLATNGSEYLVVSTLAASSRLPTGFVSVNLLSSDGRQRATVTLPGWGNALSGGAAWDGERWAVASTNGGMATVTFLDTRLVPDATVIAGAGSVVGLVTVQRSVWVFIRNADEIEAVEVLPDGTTGRRHRTSGSVTKVVSTSEGALLFGTSGEGVMVTPFAPDRGFEPIRLAAPGRVVQDALTWDDGAAVLLTDAAHSISELLIVDASGRELSRTILNSSLASTTEVRLGDSAGGLLYFESRSDPDRELWRYDVYAYRLAGLQLVEPPELISIANLARQESPLIASNGTHAVAFWNETNPDLTMSLRSRAISADGDPFGPIHTLAAMPVPADIAFDGETFIAVWTSQMSIYAAAISADGSSAGTPMLIGEGSAPAVAARPDATYVVWSDASGTLRGVNLRDDASAVVPGGSPLLPAFAEAGVAEITTIGEGFFVGWTGLSDMRALVLSPKGAPIRGVELGMPRFSLIDLESRGNSALGLITGPDAGSGETRSYLYAFNGDGRPFEAFDPHWGDWQPWSLHAIADDRYLVVVTRGGSLFTSEVSMTGAFITGITPLRSFRQSHSVTTVNGTPLGLYSDSGIYVTTGKPSGRSRAVRAR